MKFGFSFGEPPVGRTLELARLAEQNGFEQAWAFDSHILFQECYTLLGLLAGQTDLELGTCVTHPQTRDATVTASAFATLAQANRKRVICGIGRGDSAVRLMKRRPARVAEFERAIGVIRGMTSGETVDVDGVELELPWADSDVAIYVAGYGPKVLTLAGRLGDGVMFQIADPFVIDWGMQFVRAGAEAAGRDPDSLSVHCATASMVSDDLEYARNQCRWYPAIVGNHVADVMRNNDASGMPDVLTDYLGGRENYDYSHHMQTESDHAAYVPDEIVDRFCILGSPKQCAEKVRELAAAGVNEINLYPTVENFEGVIEAYGQSVIPAVREHAAT
jgi:probable F420-dependent oxidoreductase